MKRRAAVFFLAVLLAALCARPAAAGKRDAAGAAPVPDDAPPPVAELARAMTARYHKLVPREWRERGPGITSRLPQTQYRGVDPPPAQDGAGRTGSMPPRAGTGQTPQRGVALTLDACDGRTDMRIIALLRECRVPATIFVTTIWLRGNAALAAELAADPLFTLQAHGARHKPASVAGWSAFGIPGTGNVAALVDEVETNARAIAAITGTRPHWYRSGTAFYDDVALEVIREMGFGVAGFAVSADSGATLPARSVAKRLRDAKDGDIVLCHVNHPESGTYEGLRQALPLMLQAGIQFVGL